MSATLRPLLVALASTSALTAVVPLCADPLLEIRARVVAGSAWATLPLDLVLASLAAAAVGLCGLWITAVTLATTAEALTGRSWATARAITPRLVRRGVLALCGLAVGGAGVAVPATAAPPEPSPTADRATASATLDGLPVPDRVEGRAPAATPPQASAPRRAAAVAEVRGTGGTRTLSAAAEPPAWAVHRVVPGDSLWSIAAALHPAAEASEIDRTWRRIYRANRSAVGSDPHLLRPGTTLRLPQPSTTADGAGGPRRPVIPSPRKDAS
jgi:resuscitation-promoting factor RpfA